MKIKVTLVAIISLLLTLTFVIPSTPVYADTISIIITGDDSEDEEETEETEEAEEAPGGLPGRTKDTSPAWSGAAGQEEKC